MVRDLIPGDVTIRSIKPGAPRMRLSDGDDMTATGFRAMARTLAAERLGIAPEVIAAQLAHAVPDALGRACNRTQYLDPRRDMMTRWVPPGAVRLLILTIKTVA
ncbi:hypothetical protein [Leptothrix discophora]|uniref:hypothetical protein n=1 Tax=Leptothrix discophora TaxID=89 RepID=UPI00387E21E8